MSFGDSSEDTSSEQESTCKKIIIQQKKILECATSHTTLGSQTCKETNKPVFDKLKAMSFGDSSEDTSSEQESTCKKIIIQQKKILECPTLGSQTCKDTNKPGNLKNVVQIFRHEHKRKIEEASVEEPILRNSKKTAREHQCPETGCEAAFTRPYRLKNHIASQHEGQKPFKCLFEGCDNSYSNWSHLKRHKIVHLGEEDHSKEVMCGTTGCGLVCANKYSLKKHIAAVHRNLFKCHLCDEQFRRKSHLNSHKSESHNAPGPYKCTKCPREFVHLHLYNKHMDRHRTYTCDCEKSFGKWTEYLKHKRTDCTIPKTKYKCIICSKTFTLKQNLTQHCLKVHLHDSQVDDFKCPYLDCHKSYKYKRNLNCHIKSAHDKIFEYFKCTESNCQTVLKTKKNLKHHLKLCHSDRPLKEKVHRKPRKDKGLSKKNTASELSGVKVSCAGSKKNINRLPTDKDLGTAASNNNVTKNDGELTSYINSILYKKQESVNDTDTNETVTEKCSSASRSPSLPPANIGDFSKGSINKLYDVEICNTENNAEDKVSCESLGNNWELVFDFQEFTESEMATSQKNDQVQHPKTAC